MTRHGFSVGVAAFVAMSAFARDAEFADAPYMNATLPVEERVSDLVSRMTVREKCAQLGMLRGRFACSREAGSDTVVLETNMVERMRANPFGKITQMLRPDFFTRRNWDNGLLPHQQAETVNAIQRIAVEATRLGIPIWFEDEAPHGIMALGEPVYPTGLGLGSTYDKGLMRRIGEAMGRSARAKGLICVLAPILDIARDPRWSRVEECFGEDPTLVALMGEAETAGITAGGATSCLKHYVAGGLSEGGHNGTSVKCGPYGLLNAETRPFRAAIRAGALEIMSTYHDIDGEPCTSSHYLLEDVLRGQLGFRGFVRSDAGAIENGWGHGLFNTIPEAFAAALKAGGDTDYQRNTIELCGAGWREAYDRGLVAEADLDKAVARVLRAKFELGLFEHPYAEPPTGWKAVPPVEDGLTLEAARKSLVLLKNDGALPLAAPRRVAVVGPNAGERIMNQLGDYTYTQRREDVVTVLDGVRKLAGGATVGYARGCAVRDFDRSGFPAAIALAKDSDVTVLVLGGSSSPFSPDDYDPVNGGVRANASSNAAKSDKECGEGTDRCTLNYSGVQLELFREIRAVARKLVVVLIQGRPLEAEELVEKADAVLLAWYPGSRGGEAVAEALYGKVNPGGRLSVSIPRAVGQLPVTDDSRWPKRRAYIDGPSDALLPAGFGLSYTTFAYSDFRTVDADARGVPKRLEVTVTNTGAREGDEVVRFYVTVRGDGRQRPWRELIDFSRVTLKPGESRVVTGEVREEYLGYYDPSGRFVAPDARLVLRFSADGWLLPPPTDLAFDGKDFSWKNPKDDPRATQRFCHVLVASSPEKLAAGIGDIWDSGELCTQRNATRYTGEKKLAGAHYWKVRTSMDFVWTRWSEVKTGKEN